MKDLLKTLAIMAMVGTGSLMIENTTSAFISALLILIGGFWGGYLDGYKRGHDEGKRYMLGEVKNIFK